MRESGEENMANETPGRFAFAITVTYYSQIVTSPCGEPLAGITTISEDFW